MAALVLLPMTACGSDDTSGGGGGTTTAADLVVTTSDELRFDQDSYTASAGTVTIQLDNPGALPHTLLIEGNDGFKLETNGDDSDSGTVSLEPGSYTIFCDVPGHRASGMEATLEVS